jgi:putative ABC transport system substrate-binding protein
VSHSSACPTIDISCDGKRWTIPLTPPEAAIEVRDSEDLLGAVVRAVRGRADALLTITGAFFGGTLLPRQVGELALQHRLPSVSAEVVFADQGGLIYFGANVRDAFRRAAAQVDKILKGARPGDLPFELPTTYDLVVNLRTARALGLTIPPSIRLQATRVIE